MHKENTFGSEHPEERVEKLPAEHEQGDQGDLENVRDVPLTPETQQPPAAQKRNTLSLKDAWKELDAQEGLVTDPPQEKQKSSALEEYVEVPTVPDDNDTERPPIEIRKDAIRPGSPEYSVARNPYLRVKSTEDAERKKVWRVPASAVVWKDGEPPRATAEGERQEEVNEPDTAVEPQPPHPKKAKRRMGTNGNPVGPKRGNGAAFLQTDERGGHKRTGVDQGAQADGERPVDGVRVVSRAVATSETQPREHVEPSQTETPVTEPSEHAVARQTEGRAQAAPATEAQRASAQAGENKEATSADTAAHAPEHGGIPVMITNAMRRELVRHGMSEEDIAKLRPEEAWARLHKQPAQRTVEPAPKGEEEKVSGAAQEQAKEHVPSWQEARHAYQEYRDELEGARDAYFYALQKFTDKKNEKGLITSMFKPGSLKEERAAVEEAEKKYFAITAAIDEKRQARTEAYLRRMQEKHPPAEMEPGSRAKEMEERINATHLAVLDRHIDQDVRDIEHIKLDLTEKGESKYRAIRMAKAKWAWYRKLPFRKKMEYSLYASAAVGAALGATGVISGGLVGGAMIAGTRRLAGGTVGTIAALGTKLGVDKGVEALERARMERSHEKFTTQPAGSGADEKEPKKQTMGEATKERLAIKRTTRAGKRAGTVAAVGAAYLAGGQASQAATTMMEGATGIAAPDIPEHASKAGAPSEPTTPALQHVEHTPPGHAHTTTEKVAPGSTPPEGHKQPAPPEVPRLQDVPTTPEHAPEAGTEIRDLIKQLGGTKEVIPTEPTTTVPRALDHVPAEAAPNVDAAPAEPVPHVAALHSEGPTSADMRVEDMTGDHYTIQKGVAPPTKESDAMFDALKKTMEGNAGTPEQAAAQANPDTFSFKGTYEAGASVEHELQQFLQTDDVKNAFGELTQTQRGQVAHLIAQELAKDPAMAEALKVHNGNWDLVYKDDAYSTSLNKDLITRAIEQVRANTEMSGAGAGSPDHVPAQNNTIATGVGHEQVAKSSSVVVPETNGNATPAGAETVERASAHNIRAGDFTYRTIPGITQDLETAQAQLPDYHGEQTLPAIQQLFKQPGMFNSLIQGQEKVILSNWGPMSHVRLKDLVDSKPGVTYNIDGTEVRLSPDTEAMMRSILVQLEHGGRTKVSNIQELFNDGYKNNMTVGNLVQKVAQQMHVGNSAEGVTTTAVAGEASVNTPHELSPAPVAKGTTAAASVAAAEHVPSHAQEPPPTRRPVAPVREHLQSPPPSGRMNTVNAEVYAGTEKPIPGGRVIIAGDAGIKYGGARVQELSVPQVHDANFIETASRQVDGKYFTKPSGFVKWLGINNYHPEWLDGRTAGQVYVSDHAFQDAVREKVVEMQLYQPKGQTPQLRHYDLWNKDGSLKQTYAEMTPRDLLKHLEAAYKQIHANSVERPHADGWRNIYARDAHHHINTR